MLHGSIVVPEDPMTDSKSGITERQQFWLDHIKAAEAGGGTLVDYAAHHELKVRDL